MGSYSTSDGPPLLNMAVFTVIELNIYLMVSTKYNEFVENNYFQNQLFVTGDLDDTFRNVQMIFIATLRYQFVLLCI